MPLALSTIQHRGNTDYAQSHYLDCPHASAWNKRDEELREGLRQLEADAPEVGRLYAELTATMTDEQKQRLAAAKRRRQEEQE